MNITHVSCMMRTLSLARVLRCSPSASLTEHGTIRFPGLGQTTSGVHIMWDLHIRSSLMTARRLIIAPGVNITGEIGINLSAETDHDSDSTLQYTFPEGGYLCGTTGYAGSTAASNTIYAGKWQGSKSR